MSAVVNVHLMPRVSRYSVIAVLALALKAFLSIRQMSSEFGNIAARVDSTASEMTSCQPLDELELVLTEVLSSPSPRVSARV